MSKLLETKRKLYKLLLLTLKPTDNEIEIMYFLSKDKDIINRFKEGK